MDIFNKEKIADLEAELEIYKARCECLQGKLDNSKSKRNMYQSQRDAIIESHKPTWRGGLFR